MNEEHVGLMPMMTWLRCARIRAQELEQEVFLADDEQGDWRMYLADEEGYTPAILLAVSADGRCRLIDNTVAGNSEEPWRQ